jgi:hypothetical protein
VKVKENEDSLEDVVILRCDVVERVVTGVSKELRASFFKDPEEGCTVILRNSFSDTAVTSQATGIFRYTAVRTRFCEVDRVYNIVGIRQFVM